VFVVVEVGQWMLIIYDSSSAGARGERVSKS